MSIQCCLCLIHDQLGCVEIRLAHREADYFGSRRCEKCGESLADLTEDGIDFRHVHLSEIHGLLTQFGFQASYDFFK